MNTPSSPTPDERTGTVDLSRSVAGEEDPGASIDMTQAAAMAPGDKAPAGTPGTGEGVCRGCGGSGRIALGACTICQGTGKVKVGVGGA